MHLCTRWRGLRFLMQASSYFLTKTFNLSLLNSIAITFKFSVIGNYFIRTRRSQVDILQFGLQLVPTIFTFAWSGNLLRKLTDIFEGLQVLQNKMYVSFFYGSIRLTESAPGMKAMEGNELLLMNETSSKYFGNISTKLMILGHLCSKLYIFRFPPLVLLKYIFPFHPFWLAEFIILCPNAADLCAMVTNN